MQNFIFRAFTQKQAAEESGEGWKDADSDTPAACIVLCNNGVHSEPSP
jgi:hypothetical protein